MLLNTPLQWADRLPHVQQESMLKLHAEVDTDKRLFST